MHASEVVASTANPTFAVDRDGAIIAWNSAAETFFGYRETEVRRRRCWEVLHGQDVFGNDYCGEKCPLIQMALRRSAVNRCELVFTNACGERVRAGLNIVVVQEAGETAILHLIGPATSPADSRTEGWTPANSGSRKLTCRELEVLRLLGDGKSAREITRQLFISPATTRNHIQHILKKLRVHSRLEAVVLARRLGLVSSDHGRRSELRM